MRILIASLAAATAVVLAAPSFAQDTTPAATPSATPAPSTGGTTPVAKPKVGTAAYCNTLKSSTAKSSCLKRVQAQASAPKSAKAKPKKLTTKPDSSAEAAPQAQAPPQTINVPPLPQKTI